MIPNSKIFWVSVLALAVGCAQLPRPTPPAPEPEPVVVEPAIDPSEMHVWTPPNEETLASRHQRQKELDRIRADIDNLFMEYADTLGDEIILENLVSLSDPHLGGLDESVSYEVAQLNDINKEYKEDIGQMGEAVGILDSELDHIRQERAARVFHMEDYKNAILLFRDHRYKESIAAFNKLLKTNYPPHIHDNIFFGLGANYFRMKHYKTSLKYYEPITKDHPNEDKWLVSHAMVGLIYTLQGKNSRAIYILQNALEHKPPDPLKDIIQRLLQITKRGSQDVSS